MMRIEQRIKDLEKSQQAARLQAIYTELQANTKAISKLANKLKEK